MKRPLDVRVECYAGYKAGERPLRFFLAGRPYEVMEVEDRWFSPDSVSFRVRADDGNLYILRHTDKGNEDSWTVESYRAGPTGPSPPVDETTE
jgi:hypothetical protein